MLPDIEGPRCLTGSTRITRSLASYLLYSTTRLLTDCLKPHQRVYGHAHSAPGQWVAPCASGLSSGRSPYVASGLNAAIRDNK